MRIDKRNNAELRPVSIKKKVMEYAEGSAFIEIGNTKVLCTATVIFESPPFRNSKGWITAEYGMLPRATHTRNKRDISNLKKNSRASEIERLIGRSLRSCVDLDSFENITILIDCDVIQADGGTRTASINGGYVAMVEAFKWLLKNGHIEKSPVKNQIGAISAGIVNDAVMVDLCYEEDSDADTDLNIVMTNDGKITEIQATAEKHSFTREQMNNIIDVSYEAILKINKIQTDCIGEPL